MRHQSRRTQSTVTPRSTSCSRHDPAAPHARPPAGLVRTHFVAWACPAPNVVTAFATLPRLVLTVGRAPHRTGHLSSTHKLILSKAARGEGDSGGHVLREKTSRGLCGLVCPLRTSERGGEGDCVKEGGGGVAGASVCSLCSSVCFITAGPITKLCALGEEESGGHVL
jgi:hypothetical protein